MKEGSWVLLSKAVKSAYIVSRGILKLQGKDTLEAAIRDGNRLIGNRGSWIREGHAPYFADAHRCESMCISAYPHIFEKPLKSQYQK